MKLILLFIILSLPAWTQEEEETEALRAMKISCVKHNLPLGCYNYANMLVRGNKPEEADKFFEMGCKLSHEPSCSKEKWDIPERKESKEVVELPADSESAPVADAESQEAEAADEPMRPIYLPSRVTVRGGATDSEPSSIPGDMPPEMNSSPSLPSKAPAAIPAETKTEEAQSTESSGPDEALPASTPTDGSAPPSSLGM